MNERVPAGIEQLHMDTNGRVERSGISAPLLAMEGGWALGGLFARRVVDLLLQKTTNQ